MSLVGGWFCDRITGMDKVVTLQLREDGELKESITIPSLSNCTSRQAVERYAELLAKYHKFTEPFTKFRDSIKSIISMDYPGGYALPNGKQIVVEKTKSISRDNLPQVIGYLKESGHADLVVENVDMQALLDKCATDPQLNADMKTFLKEAGSGTLKIQGRALKDTDVFNPDIVVDQPGLRVGS